MRHAKIEPLYPKEVLSNADENAKTVLLKKKSTSYSASSTLRGVFLAALVGWVVGKKHDFRIIYLIHAPNFFFLL